MSAPIAGPESSDRILLVGFGNTLRGDDGLGPFLVENMEERKLPGVRVLSLNQLTPELSAELARVKAVIFVDACLDVPAGVSVTSLTPRVAPEGFSHVADVESLLGLTGAVYHRVPQAWLVRVAGRDFTLQEGLSQPAQGNARLAQRHIENLIHQILAEND